MKALLCLSIAVGAMSCAQSQLKTNIPENTWKATLKVIDGGGRSVTGAVAWVSFYITPPLGQTEASEKIEGLTDSSGLFTASHRDRSLFLGFHAEKAGYYPAWFEYALDFPTQYDPVKWNPNVTLLLKKIVKPIPMYAKWLNTHVPVLDTPVGFDLLTGDWVAPHGKGRNKDFVFTRNLSFKSNLDYEGKVTLAFSNPGDGIQMFQPSEIEKTSSMKSPHEAPQEGYESMLTRETSAHPGQSSKYEYEPHRIYFFRVRTVLDDSGNVKSANYGKIYGDFMQLRYFLNPTPNDRNIEFDPKRNLFPENVKGGVSMDMP